ncbi:hypothetical protein C5167_035383 [Papaver somniferum]|uniref:FACT complex subunit n=1 Tax=Papaver somniferum TaxID=3469 RepID=A0A4Y7KJQ8_PAPSO|nr:hypothetical protein C5167_035383 [Papaver somniferum]
MMNQAKLGHLSRRFIVRRCWVQSRTTDSSGGGPPLTRLSDVYQERLQKHEDRRVARIHQVMIGGCDRHSCGSTGTIEAHVNGCEYSDCILDDYIVIMHDNVEWCFYGLGNEMQPPLMQFHLKRPIKIRNAERKDIQIRVRTCESERAFTPIDFQALDEFKFDAADLPTGAPTTCALTRSALVVLTKEPPYLVVPLGKIQFVNLACFGDGIEMTVIFNELDRDVFQLGSIPLGYLTDMKRRLNREDVKYYVNTLRPAWSDKLRLHRELTEVFLAGGGWDFLEDSLTLSKYPHFDPHSVRENYDRARKDIKTTMRKIVRVDPESQEWFRILLHLFFAMEICESSERIGNSVPTTLVNHDSEEVSRMMNQARLGHLLRRATVERCKGQSSTTDSSGRIYRIDCTPVTTSIDRYKNWPLQKHDESWVARILNVILLLPGQGKKQHIGTGTIEAHVNGFTYSDHGCDEVFMHRNVEWYFYELGNGRKPPLMQFHLKHPIKIRNTETKDIQFLLVPKALDEFQFDAAYLPTGAPTICALTRNNLVVLKEAPYLVVWLWHIQIVNLACFGDRIDMTVVFKVLERDVLQLGSIPLEFLAGIKYHLNRKNVKYYVNNLRPNWKELVSEVRERPEMFIAKGGWDIFEDSLTLAYYPRVDSTPVQLG